MSNKDLGPNPDREENVTNISSAQKVLLLLVVALVAGGIYFWIVKEDPVKNYTTKSNAEEPKFSYEGDLVFVEANNSDTLAYITIEVADDDEQRAQGLMYRSIIPDTTGMLFIFDEAQSRSFWMKNTKVPLDILYINDDKEIFMIYKSVMPYSEQSIPSEGAARYVVEVAGGYTTRHQIEEGDKISFRLN